MPCFRTSSTCRSRCQAPLCHCTRTLVTKQREGTLGSLRYAFGGDHPSQTTHHAVSPVKGLDPRQEKGRISTSAPRFLAKPTQRLRPILHVPCPGTTRSCSKGSRGLSVLPQVIRIFTNNTISPGPWLRQRPSRYAIRAGRNLPDKEFRYLRMVIVTTAVYWGLNSPPHPMYPRGSRILLTFQHRAGVSPYTSPYGFARTCVFSKQSLPPVLCDPCS